MSFILLAFIVLLSFTIQAMSGFGSTIIAVTLGSYFFPIETLLPTLVLPDMLINLYIAVRHRHKIQWGILLKKIIPFMGIGLVIGLTFFHILSGPLLKKIFGVFVVLLSAWEIFSLIRSRGMKRPLSALQSAGVNLAAGIVQGVYASGGPLTVYAAGRLDMDKSAFRSTLAALWTVVDAAMIVSYAASGRFNETTLQYSAFLMPVIGLGLVFGEILHSRVRERPFRLIIFAILLFAGTVILL